jgi:hypothetical protein
MQYPFGQKVKLKIGARITLIQGALMISYSDFNVDKIRNVIELEDTSHKIYNSVLMIAMD